MSLVLAESLDITTVMDSGDQYKAALNGEQPLISVNGQQVNRADAAGIQLLASLFLTAKNNQKDIVLEQPSRALIDGITILGLADLFELSDLVREA